MGWRIWDEIPAGERMTEADYRRCQGASDHAWLARKLSFLRETNCAAGVAFGDWGKWAPCALSVQPGETFCVKHGGAKKPPMDTKDKMVAQLERKMQRIDDEITAMNYNRMLVVKQLQAITEG